jgi:hypothetical protein
VSIPESVVQLRTARRRYLQARQKRYDELRWQARFIPDSTPTARFCIDQMIVERINREEKEDSSDG